jgi:hypothetical protein
MADPLSIAGSVVGITAAGVQASVKLYALAEKVATASQRVTSIADDISSTCAILNQVRELIIPQPDAHGTLRSVFNSVALNDISHALGRCRSAFTDIDTFLRRAFEQVGKRPALRSNIELSRFERAKWPFLQPQFEDLRNDLRDAKGNLVLMIAVASLALAQRGGRQRPIHETERLELGSTIIQLQQARTPKPPIRNAGEGLENHSLANSSMNFSDIGSDTSIPSSSMLNPQSAGSVKAASPSQRQGNRYISLSRNRTRQVSLATTPVGLSNLDSASNSYTWSHEQASPNRLTPSAEVVATTVVKPHPTLETLELTEKITAEALAYLREPHPPATSPKTLSSTLESTAVSRTSEEQPQEAIPPNVLPAIPSVQSTSNKTNHYQGWTTNHLQGLVTGYGDSLLLSQMELPERSLEILATTSTNEGHDPYTIMLKLTREQQRIIKGTYTAILEAELVYLRLEHRTTVSSVFGTLNIATLEWIVTFKVPWQGFPVMYDRPLPQSQNDDELSQSYWGPPLAASCDPSIFQPPMVRSKTHLKESTGLERKRASYSSTSPFGLVKTTGDIFMPVEDSLVPEPDLADYPNVCGNGSSVEQPTHSETAVLNTPDQSQDEIEPYESPAYTSEGPYTTVRRYKVPSELAEEDEEDIVTGLLARWTTP